MATKNPKDALWRKHLPSLMTTKNQGNEIPPTAMQIDLVIEICNDLNLDPLLGELVLFKGRPYITEAGLMKIATRSGQLDGMTVNAEFTDPDGAGDRWIANVVLYRKDASHPFEFFADQKEYENPQSGIWRKNKRSMTEKCCNCKTIRHAFSISLPSFEELGIDERTGVTAAEAQSEARAETNMEQGEQKATAVADAKAAKKQAAKDAKAETMSEDQRKQMVALYKALGFARPDAVAFFKEHHADLQDERFLTTTTATSYILHLWKLLADRTVTQFEISSEDIATIMSEHFPNHDFRGMSATEWPKYIRALKWFVIDRTYAYLGWSEGEIDTFFHSKFRDLPDHLECGDEQLNSYINDVMAELSKENVTTTSNDSSAPKDGAGTTQPSLLDGSE